MMTDPHDVPGKRTIRVEAPAQADAVHVLRAVVGSVASRLGFAYDRVDDLRLATSEVLAHLLEEQPPTETLVVHVNELDGAVEVVAARTTPADAWPGTGARYSLTTLILRALADEAEFERTDEGPAIRFLKRAEGDTSSAT